MSYSGSSRTASYNGISFNISADADPNIQNVPFKDEGKMTHTGSSGKRTRQQCSITNIKHDLSFAEYEVLNQIMIDANGSPIKCSYTAADGTMYKSECRCEISEYSAMEGTANAAMHAVYKFDVFAA